MTKTLEIDIRSAEGLKVNRKLVKRKTLAVARIGEKSRTSGLYETGGSEPTWNYKFDMPMNESEQFIFIEVFYRTSSGHNKKIGKAKIPTTDFMGKYSPEGHCKFLSYRLRDGFGDKCGLVNVSIMVKTNGCTSQAEETGLWRPRTEAPTIDGYGGGGRVVTGVPVWCVIQRPT